MNRLSLYSIALLSLAATACGPQTTGPADAKTNPVLEAQLASIRQTIEAKRQGSGAAYDSLMQVWKARTILKVQGNLASDADPFVPCSPLPFDATSQIIGPAGGKLRFGPHRLYIPPGALSDSIAIGAVMPPSLTDVVQMLPHGLVFNLPVKLVLVYSQCDPTATHHVAYTDDDYNILEWPTSTDNTGYQSVVAWLNHFSQYAVAY